MKLRKVQRTHCPASAGRILVAVLAIGLFAGMFSVAHGQQQNGGGNSFFVPVRNLPDARAFHGSAVLGDFLYIFSGQRSDGTNKEDEEVDQTVWRAPISNRTQVGQWERTTALPEVRCYIANSTLVINDVVYIIGGSDAVVGGEFHDTAIWSKPLPNGTLTPWQESSPIPEGISTPAAVSTPGHIHVIGGLAKDKQVSNRVWTNPVFPDGSLSKWEAGPPMPIPLWFHQAGVVAGRVYVWGGLMSTAQDDEYPPPSPYIISAPILSSGKLGAWRREQIMLPMPFYAASTTVAGPFLMSFSPRYEAGSRSNDVWFTRIGPRGMEPWNRKATTVPNKAFGAVCADYRRGLIFLTGGRGPDLESPMLRPSFVFGLTGDAARQAEQSWLATQTAHSNSVSALAASLEQNSGKSQGSGTPDRYLSYLADRSVQEGAVEGFTTVTEARQIAQREKKPLIMYFSKEDAIPCMEQKEHLLTRKFLDLMPYASFAWIDTTEYPQLCQQMGVYRVPTWIFFDASGEKRGMRIGVMTPEELVAGLLSIRQ